MSQQPEFTLGDVWDDAYNGEEVAEIDHHIDPCDTWKGRIKVHGEDQIEVVNLRERVLDALTGLTDDELQLLEDLVSLGGTYAEDAVTQGLRSWHPFNEDRMRHLATNGYGQAFTILRKLRR